MVTSSFSPRRQRKSRWGLAVLIVTALQVGGIGQSFATPSDTQPADESNDGVSKTVSVQMADLPEISQQTLSKYGVDGANLDVDQRGEFTWIDDGKDWVIVETASAETGSRLQPLSFNIGVCAGSFFDIIKVGSNMEWGGQNSCATLKPNTVYPHKIRSQLRSGKGIVRTPISSAYSPSNSSYNTVVTAAGLRKCKSNASYKYDQVVTVTLKGVEYGPKVSDSVTLACNSR